MIDVCACFFLKIFNLLLGTLKLLNLSIFVRYVVSNVEVRFYDGLFSATIFLFQFLVVKFYHFRAKKQIGFEIQAIVVPISMRLLTKVHKKKNFFGPSTRSSYISYGCFRSNYGFFFLLYLGCPGVEPGEAFW